MLPYFAARPSETGAADRWSGPASPVAVDAVNSHPTFGTSRGGWRYLFGMSSRFGVTIFPVLPGRRAVADFDRGAAAPAPGFRQHSVATWVGLTVSDAMLVDVYVEGVGLALPRSLLVHRVYESPWRLKSAFEGFSLCSKAVAIQTRSAAAKRAPVSAISIVILSSYTAPATESYDRCETAK